MSDREYMVIKYQKRFEEAKLFLEEKYNREFAPSFLSALLGHHFDSDDVHTYLIFHPNIDSIDLVNILVDEFENILGTFNFNLSNVESLISDRIEKARIKDNGLIWIIHNNDKDPFPSKPHAHEYTINIKLHLRTGECYRKGKVIQKLGKKEFQRLLQKIESEGMKLPQII